MIVLLHFLSNYEWSKMCAEQNMLGQVMRGFTRETTNECMQLHFYKHFVVSSDIHSPT